MNTNTIKSRLIKTTILAGFVGSFFVPAMAAQETPSEPDAIKATEPVDSGEARMNTIKITGTRIQQPDFLFSSPVVSMDSEAITNSGTVNLTNFLQDMPALLNSFDSEDSAATTTSSLAGLNLLDLRGLGTERTLVLVNGRRHVSSDAGTAAVDVNTIPVSLIESIQVMTGGASAVYGADAVSGAVNFVMKDNFEGAEFRSQYGVPTQGGGETTFLSAAVGKNFLDDRLNLTAAYEYSSEEEVNRDDRDYAKLGQREVLVSNPNDPGVFDSNFEDNPALLDNIFASGVTYIDTSPGGSIFTNWNSDTLAGVSFTGDGEPWQDGQSVGGYSAVGGSGSLLDGFVDQLLPGIDRHVFNASANFEAVPGHTFFGEFKYVNSHTRFIAQPTFDFGITVPVDNPYIPAAALADAMDPDGGYGYNYGVVFVARDNFDLGNTGTDIERETFRTVAGVEGELGAHFNYEISANIGVTKVRSEYFGNRISERWLAGIDAVVDPATGDIVCRSDLDPLAAPPDQNPDTWGLTFTPGPGSGCVPTNIFGENVSAEAAAWINATSVSNDRLEQSVFNAFISGDSGAWFELPGGPVSMVLGFEGRREKSESEVSALEELSTAVGEDVAWNGQSQDSGGSYAVSEFFGEVSLPVLSDLPGVKELFFDGAYRTSNYSIAGVNETWKIGGRWRPIQDIMFRGTTAESVRAPNVQELFLPNVQTFALLDDPCQFTNLDEPDSVAVEELRLANCTADLGFDANTFDPNVSFAIEGRIGGNPNLDVETATTNTYGIVIQPRFLEGFNFSLDYYEIELEDAIQAFTAQTIVDKCYDLPRPNQFCALMSRDPTTGIINGFSQTTVNVASYKTSGYDFSVQYAVNPQDMGWLNVDIGDFQVSLVGTKLEELTFVELADAEPDEDLGERETPEWQAVFDLTWNFKKASVNYGFSWFDETERFSPQNIAVDPDIVDPGYYNYSERFTHDIQATYQISEEFSVYGGVNNFTNQEPDRGSLDYPVSPFGRYVYVGLTGKF